MQYIKHITKYVLFDLLVRLLVNSYMWIFDSAGGQHPNFLVVQESALQTYTHVHCNTLCQTATSHQLVLSVIFQYK